MHSLAHEDLFYSLVDILYPPRSPSLLTKISSEVSLKLLTRQIVIQSVATTSI